MRMPSSWMDKELLEDEPFVSLFYAHKLNAPTRGRRGGDWHLRLARDIKNEATVLTAAERWITHAFAAEGTSYHRAKGTADAFLLTFVRFYWAWYKDGAEAATKVVNDERKKHGFQYLLPEISQPGSEPAQAHSAADAVVSSLVRPSKSKRKRQRKTAVQAQANHGNAAAINVVPALENNCRREEADEERPHVANDTALQVVRNVTDCAVDAEDKEEVVFAQEQDINAYIEVALTEHGISVLPSTHEATSSIPPNTASPTGEKITSASQDDTLTVLASGPGILVAQPPAKSMAPLRKKARVEIPPEERRQRFPREAAHPERLSLMMKRERSFQENSKRGREDDLGFESLSHAVSQAADFQKASATNKSKKPTTRPPVPSDVTSSIVMEGVDSTRAQAIIPAVQTQAPSVTKASAAIASAPPTATLKRGRKAKRATARKKVNSKTVVGDGLERPNKRQRSKDGGRNAIAMLNDAMTRQARGEAIVSSEEVAPEARSQDRKRTRLRANSTSSLRGEQPATYSRKMAKMPQRKSGRRRLADIAPQVSTFGAPADLPAVDGIVRDAAAAALFDLHAPIAAVERWGEDHGFQDEPPSSDEEEEEGEEGEEEDGEEDIPLSKLLAKTRRISTVSTHLHPANWDDAPKILQDANPAASISTSLAHPAAPNSPISAQDDDWSLCWPDMPDDISSWAPSLCTASDSVSKAPQVHKQPLVTQPDIWAESRQEVCESFDWFRSYQGGVYFNNDMVKGYLLSAFSSSRDLFARDGRLIISHGGGKAESIHNKKGRHEIHEADDQREGDKSVRALLRTYEMKRPLVLIIDDRYALFPYDLAAKGYTYVVLGFYHIAHAWAERQPASNERGYVVRYKFAFEWCEKQPEPWWLKHSPTAPAPPTRANRHSTPMYFCTTCEKPSPRVYNELGMCLYPECSSFWSCDGCIGPPERLTYDQSFLDSRMECVHEMLEDVAPSPPSIDTADGVVTSRRFRKGWHCKRCGRLSCRYKWEHWECKACGAILQVAGKDRHANEFWRFNSNDDFLHHDLGANSGIIAPPMVFKMTSGRRVWYHVYILPENRGRIYLILGNPLINKAADEIFAQYQAQARSGELRFRRWPLRTHQCRGTFLTNYFSQNTGEPYQYVGGTANTVPFEGAPSAVINARNLIQERMAAVMPPQAGAYEFNEVLSAAYMETQKMAFHSDAEPGLGPRVASLSLGAPAYMYFRVLKKYRQNKGGGRKQNVLSLYLRHGDVLIMDGAGIQEYYEHTVVPTNFRIAATARYISTSAQ